MINITFGTKYLENVAPFFLKRRFHAVFTGRFDRFVSGGERTCAIAGSGR